MSERVQYRVYVNDEALVTTGWLPVAVAAWNRAVKDTDAGKQDGSVVLEKDGAIIAKTRNGNYKGAAWPDGSEPDLNDLAAALQQLARAAGVDVRALADGMGRQGLPTSRGRLDSIRARARSDQSQTSAAELIVLCYAVIDGIKGGQGAA